MYYNCYRIACDVIDSKLQVARQVGADVTINCKTQNLKDISNCVILNCSMIVLLIIVMLETSNNGIGRILDATGAVPLINACFTLLR